MRHQILVSWISFYAFPLSVKLIACLAKACGYNGLQGAPTRGIPGHSPEQAKEYLLYIHEKIMPIKFLEDSWGGYEGIWDAISRIVFESPKFAKIRRTGLDALPRAQSIGHGLEDSIANPERLIEAHPGLRISPHMLARKALQHRLRVAFDSYHAQRQFLWEGPASPDEQVILDTWRDWRSYLPALLPHIKVFHFQPHRENYELWRWLFGFQTEIGQMVDAYLEYIAAHPRYEAIFVVEIGAPRLKPRFLPQIAAFIFYAAFSFPLNWLIEHRLRRQIRTYIKQ